MKNDKTDQRSKYTQMIIKKGLLKLVADKPLNKITITELCACAGTNRITFYNHFYDIFDVYETIEKDFFNDVMEKLETLKTLAAEKSLIQAVVLHLYRYADMCNLFVSTNSTVIAKIMDTAHKKYVAEFSSTYKQVPLNIINPLFTFLLNGYVGLVIDWIKKGMEQSPEEISALMISFNKCALDGIIKNFIIDIFPNLNKAD
jgi:AcrR family transcriptional regulator